MPENLNKVARVTLLFWLMKILATTLGETLGDQLSMTMGLGYATGIGITLVAFLVVLFLQVFRRNFYAPLYWAVIVGTTTLGTEISDFMDRSLGLGYLAGSAVLLSAMFSILAVWHKLLGGIRVYPVTLRSEELFYWAAILASNSLGTAFGDLLADDLGFTYLQGAMITAGVIGVVLVLHRFTKLNHVLLFWIAFIYPAVRCHVRGSAHKVRNSRGAGSGNPSGNVGHGSAVRHVDHCGTPSGNKGASKSIRLTSTNLGLFS